jgi:hypothetical protein
MAAVPTRVPISQSGIRPVVPVLDIIKNKKHQLIQKY